MYCEGSWAQDFFLNASYYQKVPCKIAHTVGTKTFAIKLQLSVKYSEVSICGSVEHAYPSGRRSAHRLRSVSL